MSSYPTITQARYKAPVGVELEFHTLIQEFGGAEIGEETRKQKRLYPRRHLSLIYENITYAEAEVLWNFYLSMKGAFSAFNFFFRTSRAYTGEYVGVGDGATKLFNFPCKNSVSRTLKIDGVEQTEDVDWWCHVGSGEDGADQLEMNVAPVDGAKITYDFTGQLKVRGRFRDDIMSFEIFYEVLVTTGLKIKGLLNA